MDCSRKKESSLEKPSLGVYFSNPRETEAIEPRRQLGVVERASNQLSVKYGIHPSFFSWGSSCKLVMLAFQILFSHMQNRDVKTNTSYPCSED